MSGTQFDLDSYECLNQVDMDLRTPLKVFGLNWSSIVKGKKFAKPTITEIIEGIKSLIFEKLKQHQFPKRDQKLYED